MTEHQSNKGNGGKDGGTLTVPAFNTPPLQTDGRKNYTPFLVIRCAAGDYGGRPLPAGTVFWESPDVWVESSLGINQPVVGEKNKVFARVTNYGLEQANGVVVKFWWADPSVAITETSAHKIGIGSVDIPAKRSAVVECPKPWIPIEENGGHECLLAEAYVPAFDPLTAPMDPVLDRHVGQKNEQLVLLEPGMSFHFPVHLANIAPLRQAVALELHQARNERMLPLSMHLQAHAGTFVAPTDAFARGLLALGPTGGGGCMPVPWVARSLELEPWESRTVELSGAVPRDSRRGETFAFRLVERIGPLVTGGYTVVVRVV